MAADDASVDAAGGEALRRRVRERMAAEGIPHGTDDPLLLALGASPLHAARQDTP